MNEQALVIGNGESRRWFCPSHQVIMTPIEIWGCNAIYRDGPVDRLVAVDYSMQQEIYDSDYEMEKNDDRRKINLIQPNFVAGILDEVRQTFR